MGIPWATAATMIAKDRPGGSQIAQSQQLFGRCCINHKSLGNLATTPCRNEHERHKTNKQKN